MRGRNLTFDPWKSSDQEPQKGTIKWSSTLFADQKTWSRLQTLLLATYKWLLLDSASLWQATFFTYPACSNLPQNVMHVPSKSDDPTVEEKCWLVMSHVTDIEHWLRVMWPHVHTLQETVTFFIAFPNASSASNVSSGSKASSLYYTSVIQYAQLPHIMLKIIA